MPRAGRHAAAVVELTGVTPEVEELPLRRVGTGVCCGANRRCARAALAPHWVRLRAVSAFRFSGPWRGFLAFGTNIGEGKEGHEGGNPRMKRLRRCLRMGNRFAGLIRRR